MLKYLSKMAMDMLPSVAATIIGAYVVNHYIITRPGADAPAAAVSSVSPKKALVKVDARPAAASVDTGNIPAPGVTAKGISEKALLEKTAAERPAVVEKPAAAEKPADKLTETASIPVETRHPQPLQREKAMVKSAPAAAPVVAAPSTVLPAEAAAPVDQHRDANDLARAAIERLRGTGDASPRTQEVARVPDAPHVASAPVASAPLVAPPPAVRPLPPPIMVSTPAVETPGSRGAPDYPAAATTDDPSRPIPPADIPLAAPSSPPLDLRADVGDPPKREHTTVAQDMLLAAKSVFHAILPK